MSQGLALTFTMHIVGVTADDALEVCRKWYMGQVWSFMMFSYLILVSETL